MGCFPACFGHLRRNVTTEKVQHLCLSPSNESVKLLPDKTESHKEEKEEEIINAIKIMSESEYKPKEQTDVHKTNEEKAVVEYSNVKKCTNELVNSNSDKLLLNKNVQVQKEREKDRDTESHQDFLINDKECEAVASLEYTSVEENSCSSLFSLSIDSRNHFLAAEMGDKEVSSLLKMKNTSSKYDEEKENVPLSKDLKIEQPIDKSKAIMSSIVAVETSLSTWLVESEKSPQKRSIGSSPESEKNYQDRQILGVIGSPADVKKLNGFSTVGSTPCCSGDDQPGVGTVGQYWQRRGRIGEVAGGGSGSSCRL